jgi:hypothetical protein
VSKGFFDNRVKWKFERNGTIETLPYFYYDAGAQTAIFSATSSKVRELLPLPGMNPVEIFPGRCLVAISGFEYRKTDGLPYNEVSIAFLITFNKPQVPGFTVISMMMSRVYTTYVWQLPVTTEAARAGGVDLFGYPKFVADIDFIEDGDWTTVSLAENDQKILQLRGNKLGTKPGKQTRYLSYNLENGTPLIAEFLVNPISFGQTIGGESAMLELGSGHPISETLKQIGLSKQAVLYQYIPKAELILFPAENIRD